MADNNIINAPSSASSDLNRGQTQAGHIYSGGRRRTQPALSAEEAKRVSSETRLPGSGAFSPAVIVDISKNAKRLWQDALEKQGGVMNIAKPYFSSRLLDKMREAGALGPSGIASMAYKRMVDIFI